MTHRTASMAMASALRMAVFLCLLTPAGCSMQAAKIPMHVPEPVIREADVTAEGEKTTAGAEGMREESKPRGETTVLETPARKEDLPAERWEPGAAPFEFPFQAPASSEMSHADSDVLRPVSVTPHSSGATKTVDRTPAGVELEAKTGEAMYTSPFLLRSVPVFVTTTSWQPPKRGSISFPKIPKGVFFVCPYKTSLGDLACRPEHGALGKPVRDGVPMGGRYLISLSRNGRKAGYVIGESGGHWDNVPRGTFWAQKRRFVQADPKTEVRRKIFYEGSSGDTVSFSYREFVMDKPVPGKTERFGTSLSSGKPVTIRDVTFEILSARKDLVRYKIPKK